MKKYCLCVLGCLIAIVFIVGALSPSGAETEYLRIHIRADSNSERDQSVKYEIKDAVVDFLTPIVAQCDNKEKAEKAITDNLNNIERIADEVLIKRGFTYRSQAKINNEEFPTRTYGEFTLEKGYYDALIINLGSGQGDNWWCVVYPPLCFTDTKVYKYKSKIYEIIKSFFNQEDI